MPNPRASLVGRVLIDRVLPRMTAKSARRSMCQRSDSSFGVVVAPCPGNACLVVVAASLLHRCRSLVPRLWIVKEGADLPFDLRVCSYLGRK